MDTNVAPANAGPAAQPSRRRRGFPPALVLFFLAPLVGEVLAGSTPLDLLGSPATFLVVFLLEALVYGGGAILIREIARRANRGWPTILGLGLAYGVLEEGLITQSFFNPDYLGLHLLGLGSLFGLGWVWITDLLALHAVWSIAAPIALAELLFRRRGADPWLGRVGLVVVGGLFAVGAAALWLATYTSNGHFVAPWPELVGALVVAAIVAALALRLPRRAKARVSLRPAPNPWLVAIASFLAASLFMGVHQFYSTVPDLPGVLPVAATVALTAAMLALALRWSGRRGWGDAHRLALAAGALFTYAWSGFFNFSLDDRLDVAGQVGADALAVALVVVLAVRLSRRAHEASKERSDTR